MVEKLDPASQKVTPQDAQKGGQGALSKDHPEILLKEDGQQSGSAPIQTKEISNGLTSTQIELLCEIEERDLSKLSGDLRRDLEHLRSEGYVAPRDDLPGSRFSLTAKGSNFLSQRGVGLNES